jgi:hypothetical protein
MGSNRFPPENHMVTAIAVKEGNPRVLAARVVLCNDRSIVIEFEQASAQTPARQEPVTLLYGDAERILRLRTRVAETVGNQRVVLSPEGSVVEGERREFLRAESLMSVQATHVEPSAVMPSEPTLSATDPSWTIHTADLSGSGLSFDCPTPFSSGDVLHLQMRIEAFPGEVFQALAEVVRSIPAKNNEHPHRVAVHFTSLAEEVRDRLINFVFQQYFEQLGSMVGSKIDFDDL